MRATRTTSLLIDEQPLQVIPSLACRLGLNRAMFLQQLHYWLRKEGAHEIDGRRWVYNTYEGWHEQFPFWTPEAIRKIVSQLEARGIIETTDRYNERRGDRTKWYTINYEVLEGLVGAPDKSTERSGHPDKSTEQPENFPPQGPDKSTELYQRLPESNNRDSDLQSGEAAFRGSPARGERPKAKDAKQYAVGRLMDFVAEAKASGRRPAPPDEPFKRRNADIFAAHLADGYEVEELEEALRVQVRYACGEGEGRYAGKRRWIPFVDALEIAGGREPADTGEGPSPAPRQEFPPSPPEAIAAIREHDYLRRYAGVAERWDFTAEEEPPFKILARIGGDEEERWRNLERLRSVARRAVREAAA